MAVKQPPAQDLAPAKTNENTPAKPQADLSPTATASQSFVKKVERQFNAELGQGVNWSPLQQRLAQHLFVKADAALKALEIKRASNSYKQNDPAITWQNVNMTKLAIDAVHRVNLGLDALIDNHIHIIPYLNKRTGQYDVDLRIGYKGVDHIARNFSLEQPIEIKYQLVHATDSFEMGSNEYGGEKPIFKQSNPFDPGKVIGGFGYIRYAEPARDRVVIVEYREFEKAKKASGGVEFWGGIQKKWVDKKLVDGEFDEKFEKEMQFKTVVFRVCKHLTLDPEKINADTVAAMRAAELDAIDAQVEEEVSRQGNGETLSLQPVQPQEAVIVTEAGEPAAAVSATPTVTTVAEQPTLGAEEDPGY